MAMIFRSVLLVGSLLVAAADRRAVCQSIEKSHVTNCMGHAARRHGKKGGRRKNAGQILTKLCSELLSSIELHCTDDEPETYPTYPSSASVAPGRPYTVENGTLLSEAQWCSSDAEAWASGPALKEGLAPEVWTREDGKRAALDWLRDGQEEHASVASFARCALDLMKHAAPAELLAATHAAAAEEVRHAQLAFALASQLHGSIEQGVRVRAFPVDNVRLAFSLDELVARTFKEGCFNEGVAVSRLARALAAVSTESPAKVVVEELFADEARHAALAWRIVRWGMSRGAVAPSLPTKDLGALGQVPTTNISNTVNLIWAGRVSTQDTATIEMLVEKHWVRPWIAALADGEQLPVVSITQSVPDALGVAVERAATEVRRHVIAEKPHIVSV